MVETGKPVWFLNKIDQVLVFLKNKPGSWQINGKGIGQSWEAQQVCVVWIVMIGGGPGRDGYRRISKKRT